MGKRSNYPKIPRDLYPTPFNAVVPLVPFLRRDRVRSFAEPCCGDGRLVRHLESFGLCCTYAGDIATGQDALAVTDYGSPDSVVTNPPFSRKSRKVLLRLIAHFQAIAPTWLLLPHDLLTNAYMAPFLRTCSDVVPLRRLIFIDGTESGGMENHCWLRFDARHKGHTIFHPKGAAPDETRRTTTCRQCGRSCSVQRSSAMFCSPGCKQRAYRTRLRVTVRVTPAPLHACPTEVE
jgi:hypothetical protein